MKFIPKYKEGDIISKVKSILPSKVNPKNWGVSDYSKEGTRSKAYSVAKSSGEKEFLFNGKRYNTNYAGTPRQEIGKYGVNGQPVNMNQDHIQVNLYNKFGEFLPGHLETGIIRPNDKLVMSDGISMDANGVNRKKISVNGGDSQYYVYNADLNKYKDSVQNKQTYNLLTNNCADQVCKSLNITTANKVLGVTTPPKTVDAIKNKYPTLVVTGRTTRDYMKSLTKADHKTLLENSDYFIGIASSPELVERKPSLVRKLQYALQNQGYDLKESFTDGIADGILGKETSSALKDYQSKIIKQRLGGILKKYK